MNLLDKFLYEKNAKLLHYFINKNTEFKLKPSCVKIIFKNEKSFLEKNHFHLEQKNTQMISKKENLHFKKINFIDKIKKSNCKKKYNFLLGFFDLNFVLNFSIIKSTLKENDNILRKEGKIIKFILIFKTYLSKSYLRKNTITKENLKHKKLSLCIFKLFFYRKSKSVFFKFFTKRVIKPYKKAGFEFSTIKFHFIGKFNEI